MCGGLLEEAVVAAITAMNEPKTCSIATLRKFLVDKQKNGNFAGMVLLFLLSAHYLLENWVVLLRSLLIDDLHENLYDAIQIPFTHVCICIFVKLIQL